MAIDDSIHNPAPGSIAYARKCLRKQRENNMEESRPRGDASHGHRALSLLELRKFKVPDMFHPDSSLWNFLNFLGTICMQALCHSAKFSFGYQEAIKREASTVAQLFIFRGLAHMSNRALSVCLNLAARKKDPGHIGKLSLIGTAATLDSAAVMWGGLFRSMQEKFNAGEWEPIVFIRRSRYDETPLKIRLDSLCNTGLETATHAKLMQTECSVQIIFKDVKTQAVWTLDGYIPTNLKAMDATTAENTRAAVLSDLDVVPGWKSLASIFPWVLQSTTVDRFAANFKAERAMLAENVCSRDNHGGVRRARFSKFTKTCDVHVIAQVHIKTSSLMESDISGLLHTALSQHGAGTLATLHDILGRIFEEEAPVVYSSAPGGVTEQHRNEVYDLYLPRPQDCDGPSDASIIVKRHILSSLLNGDIQDEEIVHFCSFGCCRDIGDSIEKLKRYAVYALCSCKQPRFSRNRWNHQEEAVRWSGLLLGLRLSKMLFAI